MKLCHIATGVPGGISKMTLNLLEEQRQTPTLEVSVLLLASGEWTEKYAMSGVTVLDFSKGHNGVCKCWRIAQRLRQFDLVHLHFFIPSLALFLWLYRVRIVYTCHGVRGGNRQPHRFDALRQFLFRLFLNHVVCGVTYVSQYTKDYWKNHGVNPAYDKIIPNGTAFADISDSSAYLNLEINPAEYVVGVCASMGKVKRLDLLIQAFHLFLQNYPNSKLLLVGDGSELSALEKLADELGISDKVIFAGFQNNPLPYQQRMDLCVLPSVGETFGLAALEMLHLGKPVIACTDGGGICEVLAPWKEDIVDPTAEAIQKRMAYYYDYRNNDGEATRRNHYSMEFTSEMCAKRYSEFYYSVLGECSIK